MGIGLTRSSDSTIGGPRVRLGTKWASMTSTWAQSALLMAPSSDSRLAKSADRMLGEICTGSSGVRGGSAGVDGQDVADGVLDLEVQADDVAGQLLTEDDVAALLEAPVLHLGIVHPEHERGEPGAQLVLGEGPRQRVGDRLEVDLAALRPAGARS